MNIVICKYHGTIITPLKTANKRKSRLEDLPNELLTGTFRYLNARDLFRSFHNLNERFNDLIQSFQYLQLSYHMKVPVILKSNDELFSYYVYTLIIDEWIDFNPTHFPNVRRLKLKSPIPKVLGLLKGNIMPHLEHLSVLYKYTMYEINLLHNEIFSNRFPKLYSCELYGQEGLLTIQQSEHSPMIRILKTDLIDLMIYEIILRTCPNLSFLKFSIQSPNDTSTNTFQHINLKRMVINLTNSDWSDDDHTLSTLLSYVQNLHQLDIHRRNYSHNILDYIQYCDWLKSIINRRLPCLRIFKFYFHISTDEQLRIILHENLLEQIQSDFSNVHTEQEYQAQLIICRESILVVHMSGLERLPNELLIELFKYLKAPQLFQAFYNLNFRFNYLIQSLTHLTYSTNEQDNQTQAYPYIRTLIIEKTIPDKLVCFPNIRRLILDYVTEEFLVQFNGHTLPNLEYLAIYHKIHPFYMPDLRTKIFSDVFPSLKCCYISRMRSPSAPQDWTRSLSIRFLRFNDINASIYTSVLLACPNLSILKFKLPTRSKIETNFIKHINLKRLFINMKYDDYPWDDEILESYLLCVPNLEQLRISRSISINASVMHHLQYYDWLLSMISSHLRKLNQFKFDLYIHRSQELSEEWN
ncbi:unnamed protein product, partial [Adineta ricciae]